MPEQAYTQLDCWDVLQSAGAGLSLNDRSWALLRKVLWGDSWIERRHFSYTNLAEAFLLTPDVLHQRFRDHAPRLAALEGKLIERPFKAPRLGTYNPETGQFTGAAERYLPWHLSHNKASSFRRTRGVLVTLCNAFGEYRLNEIHPFMLERYKGQRKQAGFADATINRELGCLKHLFNLAISWGWVQDNPVRQVKFFREQDARDRWLTQEEESALLARCAPNLRVFILAALDTGFRAGELQSLKWSAVDFQRMTISVASAYMKNGDPRTNPMTQRLAQALQEWRMLNGKGDRADGFVFGPYCYQSAFKTARAKAGLDNKVVFHTLRHSPVESMGKDTGGG